MAIGDYLSQITSPLFGQTPAAPQSSMSNPALTDPSAGGAGIPRPNPSHPANVGASGQPAPPSDSGQMASGPASTPIGAGAAAAASAPAPIPTPQAPTGPIPQSDPNFAAALAANNGAPHVAAGIQPTAGFSLPGLALRSANEDIGALHGLWNANVAGAKTLGYGLGAGYALSGDVGKALLGIDPSSSNDLAAELWHKAAMNNPFGGQAQNFGQNGPLSAAAAHGASMAAAAPPAMGKGAPDGAAPGSSLAPQAPPTNPVPPGAPSLTQPNPGAGYAPGQPMTPTNQQPGSAQATGQSQATGDATATGAPQASGQAQATGQPQPGPTPGSFVATGNAATDISTALANQPGAAPSGVPATQPTAGGVQAAAPAAAPQQPFVPGAAMLPFMAPQYQAAARAMLAGQSPAQAAGFGQQAAPGTGFSVVPSGATDQANVFAHLMDAVNGSPYDMEVAAANAGQDPQMRQLAASLMMQRHFEDLAERNRVSGYDDPATAMAKRQFASGYMRAFPNLAEMTSPTNVAGIQAASALNVARQTGANEMGVQDLRNIGDLANTQQQGQNLMGNTALSEYGVQTRPDMQFKAAQAAAAQRLMALAGAPQNPQTDAEREQLQTVAGLVPQFKMGYTQTVDQATGGIIRTPVLLGPGNVQSNSQSARTYTMAYVQHLASQMSGNQADNVKKVQADLESKGYKLSAPGANITNGQNPLM